MLDIIENMKIYKTQEEVEKDIKNLVLLIEGDVKFECSISISASIIVTNGNITARDITAWNITARDINAWDITAWNITAWDINAWDIDAWDINAWDIDAGDILYYAFCCVYKTIKCISIKAKRYTHQEPICLDGTLEFKNKENTNPKKITIDGKTYIAVIK